MTLARRSIKDEDPKPKAGWAMDFVKERWRVEDLAFGAESILVLVL